MTTNPDERPDKEPIDWEFLLENMDDFMEDLRQTARKLLRKRGDKGKVQTTYLIQRAFLRQGYARMDLNEVTWKNRRYFFAAMHKAMYRTLIEIGRRRKRKRALPTVQPADLQLENLPVAIREQPEQVSALLAVLAKMKLDSEKEKNEKEKEKNQIWWELIQHRYFSGLTQKETAELMGVSERTVRRVELDAKKEILRILNRDQESEG